jgi:hypothetical protein
MTLRKGLGEANFAIDANGKPLANPVSLLLASTWDLTGETSVLTRNDANGVCAPAPLAYAERIPGQRRLARVRSFGSHRDRDGDRLCLRRRSPEWNLQRRLRSGRSRARRRVITGAFGLAAPTYFPEWD